MKKILSVIAISALLAAMSACAPPPAPAQATASSKAEVSESAAAVPDELAELREENAELQKQLDEATARLLEQPTEEEQAILDDLNGKAPVISAETELGGALRFYPERTKLLNDKYVFAYAEDGHEISVNMILRYYQSEDGTLEWESVLYDLGSGWEISD